MHQPYRKEWRFKVEKTQLQAENPLYHASCPQTRAEGWGNTEKGALKSLIFNLYTNLVLDSDQVEAFEAQATGGHAHGEEKNRESQEESKG